MDRLPPPLGFFVSTDDNGYKTRAEGRDGSIVNVPRTDDEREAAVRKVLDKLPNHKGRIHVNETLIALSERVLGEAERHNMPKDLVRQLKTERLLKVNRSRRPEDIPSEEVKEAFKLLDEDSSGNLDQDEVATAIKILGLSEDVKTAMAAMDTSRNGLVDENEFSDWFRKKFGRQDIASGRKRLGSQIMSPSDSDLGSRSPQVWRPASVNASAQGGSGKIANP